MKRYTILIGKSWGNAPNLIRANKQEYKDKVNEIAEQDGAEIIIPSEAKNETIVIYPDDKSPDVGLWQKNDLFLFQFETKEKYCCTNLEVSCSISYLDKNDEKAFTGEGFYIPHYPDDDEEHEYKMLMIHFCPFCGKKL